MLTEEKAEGKCEVTIVIPAFNEAQGISKVISDVRATMEKTSYTYEILVVDDGSKDGTGAMAEEAGARVIRHQENRGSGASRKTGIKAARGRLIVMIDGDGTYPAEPIPYMLSLLKDYSQVIGARKVEKGTHRFLRTIAKEAIRRLAVLLVRRPIPDLNSGLRAFRKEDIMQFMHLIPDGFSCVSTMTLAFMSNNLAVKFIPIDYFSRLGKSKFHPIKDTYRYILTVLRIITYFAPLNVFMPVAIGLCILGTLKGILDLLFTGTLQESDIILIVTGVIIGTLGLLADLIVAYGRRNGKEG